MYVVKSVFAVGAKLNESFKLGFDAGTGIDMKLSLYEFLDGRKILLIYLGESGGNVIGLDSTCISANEKNLIKKYSQMQPTTEQLIAFIKKNCTNAYSKGYRTIKAPNIRLLKTFET